jgi:hypothetical protein
MSCLAGLLEISACANQRQLENVLNRKGRPTKMEAASY